MAHRKVPHHDPAAPPDDVEAHRPLAEQRGPQSLREFQHLFATEKQCEDYLPSIRWPEGFVCPMCGSRVGYVLAARRVTECRNGHQVSLTAGTGMHRSKLTVWFHAAYLVSTLTPGISGLQLPKQLGISRYETAFQFLHMLRAALVAPDREPLRGEVEVDEGFIGGPEEGRPGRGAETKSLVDQAGLTGDHGRAAGLQRAGEARLPASADVAVREGEEDWRRSPEGPPSRQQLEAVASANVQGRSLPSPPSRLPQRICLPLPPPLLARTSLPPRAWPAHPYRELARVRYVLQCGQRRRRRMGSPKSACEHTSDVEESLRQGYGEPINFSWVSSASRLRPTLRSTGPPKKKRRCAPLLGALRASCSGGRLPPR